MGVFQRVFTVVILAILPAIAIQIYNEVNLRSERIGEAKNLALGLAYQLNDELDRTVEGIHQLLASVASMHAVIAEDGALCSAQMAALRREYPAYLSLAAADRQGKVFCGTVASAPPRDLRGNYAFDAALVRNAFAVGRYALDPLTGAPTISFAFPLRSADGEVHGAVFAAVRLDWLGQVLSAKPLPQGASLIVADGHGTIIASTSPAGPWIGKPLPDAMLPLLHGAAPGVAELAGLDGTPVFFGYVPVTLPPTDIFLGAGIAQATAMAPVARATARAAALIGAGWLLALLVAWLTGRIYIQRPLAALLRAIERWRDGDYAARVENGRSVREIGHVVSAFHDLADQLLQRERQIAERDAALRRAYRSKDILLAAAGHDLRQPLQTITIALDRLARHVQDVKERQLLARADRAVDRIGGALDHLIDVARLELGAVKVETTAFSIGNVLDEIAEEWSERAQRKGLRLTVIRSNTLVRSDPVVLAIILNNLVGNAVRYTRQGRVLVGCRHRGAEIIVEVHDTGIGIAEDAIPSVFQEFHQLEPGVAEGFGLGLSIVKDMADRLGHSVKVRSRLGSGSCFAIAVPVAALTAVAA